MNDLLIATTNSGKFAEVQAYLQKLPLRIVSLKSIVNPPQVVEDGRTYEENALKKARILARVSGLPTLADDSGLEVDALNGAPGIYSARYAGEPGDDERNNQKLLDALANVPAEKRSARFVCALALCVPGRNEFVEWMTRESCEGRIAFGPSGLQGFGYDPLFIYPPFGQTFGEVDREKKAGVSHRGKALRQLAATLPAILNPKAKP